MGDREKMCLDDEFAISMGGDLCAYTIVSDLLSNHRPQ